MGLLVGRQGLYPLHDGIGIFVLIFGPLDDDFSNHAAIYWPVLAGLLERLIFQDCL